MDPTILYVDDQQENLDGFRFTFRKNYEIHTALNSAQGFKILEEHEISIVISDQRMPDILGTEFLNQVAQRFPQCIRIILTAFADFDAVVGAINKGQVYRFLTKPWNRDEMRMTIENAHEAYLLRKENLKLIQDLRNANQNLSSNNILLQNEIEERKLIEKELQNHRDNLELIVAERTKQLAASNEELGAINEELQEVNQRLSSEIDQRKSFQASLEELNAEYQSLNEELNTYNEELKTVNDSLRIEIEKRKAAEKMLADRTDELEALNEEYLAINEELKATNYEISILNNNLEELVEKRTRELLTTEARLQTLSDNLPGGTIFRGFTDQQGLNHMIYASKGIENITGIPFEQLKESMAPFFERIFPEDRDLLIQTLGQVQSTTSVLDIVFRYKKVNEEINWIQLRTIYSPPEDGVIWWDGYAIDITDRKRAEEQAKEKEIVFKNLQELIAPVTGEKLFDTLLLNIEEILHTHSLFVAEYIEDSDILRTLSFSREREIHNNFEYAIPGTPSEKILSQGIVASSTNISALFPLDNSLIEEGIDGYVGVALTNSDGKAIGVIVAASKGEIPNLEFASQILRVFSVRIGAELLRIQKDRELIERETRFSTLFDLSPNMELITTLDGEIIDTNGAFLRFSGFSKEEIIGKRVVELKLWNSIDSLKLNEKFKKHNRVDNYQANISSRNGNNRHVLLSLAPIKIKGEPYIISTGIDITERILAEQKLAESEERFRAILQNLSDSIWIVDKNTNILYESPSARNMLGYREGELQGKRGLDLVHPDDRPEVMVEFGQALKNIEGTTPTLFRLRTADGRYIFVEGISNNRIEHPAIKGIILTLRDVTERIIKDKALRESEQKFRNIFNSSTDAIIISSLDQKILEVNDVVVKLSGYSREELLLKRTTDLATEKSTLEINKRFAQLKVNETVPPTEIDFVIGTGELLATEMTSRIIDYKGEKALLTLIRDITERKKLEKVLIDTIIQTEEKERERMAADLHDEVGPLLSSMKMYLNSLVETKDAVKALYITDQLQMLIKESITAVREISNDLSPHILNNYGLAAAVRSAVETNLQFIKIELKENLDNRRFSPNIEIIFYRIIRELLNNTIKHADAKIIDIRLFHSEEKMMLYYSDNGKGFDWQLVINSSRKGLGLMNILSRIKSMNGNYSIQTSPGKGFFFELTTPL